ncbi:unnamed protein product [Didymodactylos carnosus]|uniref:Mono(ADP-ribosyl)transferase n=1 Tax=Didymodactylos carnosus TaxID=1234261 RepID=A0A813VV31_9BILA|nr:unnamed protein product [Didymodactylos carnosus]CAF3639007.1 unnamed protein product [Didymodactylos carnosus]
MTTQLYRKVQGVFDDPLELVNHIKDDLRRRDAILLSGKKQEAEYTGTHLTVTLIWFQLLTEIFCRMKKAAPTGTTATEKLKNKAKEKLKNKLRCLKSPFFCKLSSSDSDDENEKRDLVEYCRKYYDEINDQKELENIKEFESTYQSSNAIPWYIKECFVYNMLNKSLRSKDIDTLLKFRFFILDLQEQLEQLHSRFIERISSNERSVVVYRGCQLNDDAIQHFKNNIGGIISMNGISSCSASKEVALDFLRSVSKHTDCFPVLMQFTISLKHTVFGSISQDSGFPKEEEILFAVGSPFRVDSVEQLNDGVWHIRFLLTDEEGQVLEELTDYYLDNEVDETVTLVTIATFLRDMGEYEKAIDYYQLSLDEQEVENKPLVYNNIGLCYLYQDDYPLALKYCEQALEAAKRRPLFTNATFVLICNSLGSVYLKSGDHATALTHFDKAVQIGLQCLEPTHSHICTAYDNIGDVHFYGDEHDYKRALEYYEKVKQIRQPPFIPSNHPLRGKSYQNVGMVYSKLNDQTAALHNYHTALDIYLNSLPITHRRVVELKQTIQEVLQEQKN